MAEFNIPPVSVPTDEKMEAICRPRYEAVARFMIDQWPESVRALSFPTKMAQVDPAQIRDLFDYQGSDWKRNATDLAERIDAEMDWRDHFIRLNSRSPKDVSENLITCAGRQAIAWIGASERCFEDATTAHYAKAPLYICLREPRHLWKDAEFRCFARDGEVLAVSRYFYHDEPEHVPEAGKMLAEARRFYAAHLRPHYADVVFDLYAPGTPQEVLIELNPYGLSDPCLFGSYDEVEKGGERLAPACAPPARSAG